jgi:hypothetical protein
VPSWPGRRLERTAGENWSLVRLRCEAEAASPAIGGAGENGSFVIAST